MRRQAFLPFPLGLPAGRLAAWSCPREPTGSLSSVPGWGVGEAEEGAWRGWPEQSVLACGQAVGHCLSAGRPGPRGATPAVPPPVSAGPGAGQLPAALPRSPSCSSTRGSSGLPTPHRMAFPERWPCPTVRSGSSQSPELAGEGHSVRGLLWDFSGSRCNRADDSVGLCLPSSESSSRLGHVFRLLPLGLLLVSLTS